MCGEMGMLMHSCISRFDGRAGGPAVNSYVGFYFDAAVVTPKKMHKRAFPPFLKTGASGRDIMHFRGRCTRRGQ